MPTDWWTTDVVIFLYSWSSALKSNPRPPQHNLLTKLRFKYSGSPLLWLMRPQSQKKKRENVARFEYRYFAHIMSVCNDQKGGTQVDDQFLFCPWPFSKVNIEQILTNANTDAYLYTININKVGGGVFKNEWGMQYNCEARSRTQVLPDVLKPIALGMLPPPRCDIQQHKSRYYTAPFTTSGFGRLKKAGYKNHELLHGRTQKFRKQKTKRDAKKKSEKKRPSKLTWSRQARQCVFHVQTIHSRCFTARITRKVWGFYATGTLKHFVHLEKRHDDLN